MRPVNNQRYHLQCSLLIRSISSPDATKLATDTGPMACGQIEVDEEHLLAVLKYSEVKQTLPTIWSDAFLTVSPETSG